MSRPIVSVCITTYNHEAYIERCIRSVLDQEGQTNVELVVGDDCSTDGTGAIVDRLAGEHPQIKVFRPDANIGPTQNLLAIHNAAQGDFIAYLDGDDWIAPSKLATQVAYLRRRPEIVACGHRMTFVNLDGDATGHSFPRSLADTVTLGEAVRWGMPFMASSLLYRREARSIRVFEGELFDWFFLTDILSFGPAGYLDEPLGFYTVNPTSLTASLKRRAMREKMLSLYARRLNESARLKSDIFAYAFTAALSCAKQRDPLTAEHARLMRDSFCIDGVGKLPQAVLRALGNAAALTR